MSVTISVRIPRRLKELLEELGVDWYSEVKKHLETLVDKELSNMMLSEADRIRRSIGRRTSSAAEIIREDREHAH
ncbi:antitoxin [Candidatus Bathyarchaeota archaeon]|nr:antitoxin [Candidatus Bathyarchaeota archaeon]